MKTGKIIQVLGPVVDVEFENQELPAIRDALEVQNGDKKCVMEVAQHIGNHVVRCPRCGSEFDKKIQSIKLKRTGDNKTLVRVLV